MSEERYRVIERLEAGGMAEVFVGEAVSVQGFKKRCAIKRVLPHLAQNKNFIGMFLDEARLGARLNHANIVSVFDIGSADNTYFIVMEYVEGSNLKSLMESIRKKGRHFPMKQAVYICMEACRGLSYAHELADDDGIALNLVHRDVSPPNILLSKRGEVKVTDFGLAKATTQLERTDPGVVKGKFSYLSPEAALGKEVDARADIFAMGIVLWEMLAGRRLFLGETDYQTVKLVQQANVPSIQKLNPEVDATFEEVLSKSLAQRPDHRYQSAREFGDALADYLFSHQKKVTSYDIANLVKENVGEEALALGNDQSIIDRLIQEELLRFTSLDAVDDELGPEIQTLGSESIEGAQPLDAGLFENPAEWFSGDVDLQGSGGDLPISIQPNGGGGWRESGVEIPAPIPSLPSEDLARSLETSVPPTRSLVDREPAQAAGFDSKASAAVAPTDLEPPQPGGDVAGDGLSKWLAVAVVVLGALAAAVYFIGN
ncbi:MAG: serine/threonine-protein kinase [Myxococcota bacterium]